MPTKPDKAKYTLFWGTRMVDNNRLMRVATIHTPEGVLITCDGLVPMELNRMAAELKLLLDFNLSPDFGCEHGGSLPPPE